MGMFLHRRRHPCAAAPWGEVMRTAIPNHLGQLLLLARELKGYSQRELGKRSGVSHAIIAQMETGHIKEPSFRNVVRLSVALNLKLERLANAAHHERKPGT